MTAPAWMRYTLYLAGLYNLVWGALVVFFPAWTFRVGGLHVPAHDSTDPALFLPLWQCIGMIVGVYGLGYLIAGTSPYRHWPVVLVGFLGKLFGPIGALEGALAGRLPWTILYTNLTNDLIWLPLFAIILLRAREAALADQRVLGTPD
jgi:hypothetical protein